MSGGHYSLHKARRSLLHFMLGKVGAALLGIAALLLSVRVLDASVFAAYVALVALCEMAYLISGLGLSTMAQRYVTEYRLRLAPAAFPRFVWRLQLRRLGYSGGFVLLLWPLAGYLLPVLHLHTLHAELAWLAWVLVLGNQLRFCDEVMASLLMQGSAQGSVLLRNAVRLGGYGLVWHGSLSASARSVVMIELCLLLVSLCWSLAALARYLQHSSRQPAAANQLASYHNADAAAVSRRFYLVQCVGQIYGSNMLLLLTTRLLGAAGTAALGFAQSLTDMVRNYLPAQLLLGWVRPLMVSRYVENGDYAQLQRYANLILKANLMSLLPAAVLMLVCGDTLGHWLSGGRYPQMGSLLATLLCLLMLQTAHLVLSLVTLTIERAQANVRATLCACLALPLLPLLAQLAGISGVVLTLCLSELLWCGTVLLLLRRDGLAFHFDWYGLGKLLLLGSLLLLLLGGVVPLWPAGIASQLLLCAAGMLLFLAAATRLKPLNGGERDILGKLLPARFLLW